jgi:hypothetical protein
MPAHGSLCLAALACPCGVECLGPGGLSVKEGEGGMEAVPGRYPAAGPGR